MLYTLFTLFQIHSQFYITCYYMHVYIPKCNLLGLCNTACMFVFRDDHLKSVKQLVCSFLGKPVSPALSTFQLPVELRLMGFFMSTLEKCFHVVIVQAMFGQSRWWDFMGVIFQSSRRKYQNKHPDPLALTILPSPFQQCSLSLRY